MSHHPKILVLTTSYPINGVSDGGHFVQSECALLQKIGLNVSVLAPAHPKKSGKETENGMEIHRFDYFFPTSLQKVAYGSGIPNNLKSSWLAAFQLPFFLLAFYYKALKLSKEADVIHAHWFPAGFIGALIKRKHQRLVLTMHHGHKTNALFKWILKKTDYLLCNSTYTQERTKAIFNVRDQKVFNIGIETELFKPSEKPSGDFNVLFVGRMMELKGVHILLEAFKIFASSLEKVDSKLILVGDGPMKSSLMKLADKLEISSYVEWRGYVERRFLPDIYRESRILVVPSLELKTGETEGLGLTALEAFSCGLPVIGSNTGGIKDAIDDGTNGFLFESGNAGMLAEKMTDLYRNREQALQMGLKGRQKVEKEYNLLNNQNALLEAYQLSLDEFR